MSTMTHTATTRMIAWAEWTKLRTLPSTWRTAVSTMVMAIGFGVAGAFSKQASGTLVTICIGGGQGAAAVFERI
jgi:hypothetical protein